MAGARRPNHPRPNQGPTQRRPQQPRNQAAVQGAMGGQDWRDRGFESKDAQQSVTRQYGLVKQPDGSWGKPDMAFLGRQMEAQGWGPQAQAQSLNETGTPVAIGGARWNVGKNGLDFTGQASDVPFGNQPVGNAYNAGKQVPYGGGPVGTGGHMELGQKGQDTGHGNRRPRPGGRNAPGGMPGQGPGGAGGGGRRPKGGNKGLPNMPPPQAGGGMPGGVGQFPKQPTPPANFLPMTPGYEQDWRGLNDQLGQAEGQFAQGQALLPAQYNLQNTRMQNDQQVATDRLKEDLANRGVYTAKNAAGTYGGTSPAGGGIGETMYGRNVATPFGRQFQDLAADQAGRYNSLYGDYAGANLGYAQGINEALLNRANEAYQLDPMGLANSGYEVPDMAAPYYPFAPQGRPTTGHRRPRKGQNKKGNNKKGGGKK
jgi:hypothetical protein